MVNMPGTTYTSVISTTEIWNTKLELVPSAVLKAFNVIIGRLQQNKIIFQDQVTTMQKFK